MLLAGIIHQMDFLALNLRSSKIISLPVDHKISFIVLEFASCYLFSLDDC